MCPDNKIPQGLVLASKEEINDQISHFEKMIKLDRDNEAMPSRKDLI
jgi:hypothetical protein